MAVGEGAEIVFESFFSPRFSHWKDLLLLGCNKFVIECRSFVPLDVTLSEAADDSRIQAFVIRVEEE